MKQSMRVITVAAQKGGAGKSTIAIHLAVQALRVCQGAEVLLLDLDPQGSATSWAERRCSPDPIVLPVMPGSLNAYLTQAREDGISSVFIDTPPHANATIDEAVRVSDLVLIPVRPGPFDISAARNTVEIIRQISKPALFVLSQVPPTGSDGDDAEAALRLLFPDIPVCEGRIGQRKAFMQALISGRAITEFERPSSKAVTEIEVLFSTILQHEARRRDAGAC